MKNNHFFVYDVETANSGYGSLCEIATVEVINNKIHKCWNTKVNPETNFDPINTRIHRINNNSVAYSPKIPEILEQIKSTFENQIVVSHTCFDQKVIGACFSRFNYPKFTYQWVDSSQIVRAVWPEKYQARGYNLENLAKDFNLTYTPHYAIDDARVTAIIVIEALEKSKLPIDQWISDYDYLDCPCDNEPPKITKPRMSFETSADSLVENAKGMIVFTGALTIPRDDATRMANEAGYSVGRGVTRKTTALVVGEQDPDLLGEQVKSAKHRKAEDLQKSGQKIEIIDEKEFLKLIKHSSGNSG